jgi:hypothetical protein
MKGYISELHKNTLAYNLVYHIVKDLQLDAIGQQKVSETINSILTNFEYKAPEVKAPNE